MANLRIHEVPSPEAGEALAHIAERGRRDLAACDREARAIVEAVRERGDDALRELTRRLEGRELLQLEVPAAALERAAEHVPEEARRAIDHAVTRVRDFHRRQLEPTWMFRDDGLLLGQLVHPVRRAGIYAPGGKARYPSSVVMNVVPARVAGVDEVLLATPSPTPEVLYAARAAGADRVFDLGGAQAVAAFGVGTATVPRVDLVAGPGNRWVVAAKRALFGEVGIDLLAGPSETVVIADSGAPADVVAADLVAQAEHDEVASAILITNDRALAHAVARLVPEQVAALPRATIARQALENRGAVFLVPTLDLALDLANDLAPAHLVLAVAEPDPLLRRVRCAGAVFVGYGTPQAAGDFVAGPSHTLPTGGSARFSSPLGVQTFLVRTSVVRHGAASLRRDAASIQTFALLEGLEGHWRSVERRLVARSADPVRARR
ncbi:MAG: histidinol dehydrogenase [Deltaproteobacteria bacterium]|nr:histidinol dehydrogenase [Deltaproteobacteria bacterium]